MSSMPATAGLSRDEILDAIPEYLAQLEEVMATGRDRTDLLRTVDAHVATRLRQGFHLHDIVNELTVLGQCIERVLIRSSTPRDAELRSLFDLIAASITTAIATHHRHVASDDQEERRALRQIESSLQSGLARGDSSDEELLSRAAEIIQTSTGTDAAVVFLCRADGDELEIVGASGVLAPLRRARVPALGTDFAARVAHASEVGAVPQTVRADSLPGALREAGVRAAIGHPMSARGVRIGALLVATRTAESFSEAQSRHVRAFAQRLALLIDNLRLVRRCRSTVDELERAQIVRDRFVSVLAHDLRAPIAAAKLNAEILLRAVPGDDPVAATTERLVRNLERTDRMIRDLLDVNRVRAGKPLPLNLEDGEVSAVVRSAVDELEHAFGHRFQLSLASDAAAARCTWDADEVRRAIWNLGANAVKYGACDRPVTITASLDGNAAVIAVHNEGPPLAADRLGDIFEPFGRAEPSSSRKHGWGLGLTLVRACAEAHGGRVSVTSDATAGTTFAVTLPLVACE